MIRFLLASLALMLAAPAFAQDAPPPPCRVVGDSGSIRIDPEAAARLAEIGLDRAGIFESMHDTSVPETSGCWAMPTGNFDSQILSVGMAQWNFGTGSLQPVLTRWRAGFRHGGDYRRARRTLAPVYGKLLFSKDCLAVPVREKCRAKLLAAEDAQGRLGAVFERELTALFESDAMLQVQADVYVELLLAVRADLLRVFPNGPITPRKVKWATDTRVQQGYLPADEDVARLRGKLAAMTPEERWPRLRAIVEWYKALSETIDQDGVKRDYAWNVERWMCMIAAGRVDAEQYELLQLTALRSRTAIGNSGRWQALTFERRAKIILGVGSVGGVRDGDCPATPSP